MPPLKPAPPRPNRRPEANNLTHLSFLLHRQPRRARVYVPPRASTRLLVLFDGQNIFGDEGSFAGGWHADEAVSRLPGTVDRPIVVALDHGHHHRNRELWTDLDAVLDLVIHQLLPAVRERWALQGPVVLGGASLGGLAALAGHLRHPGIFGGALCISPSFWYHHGAIFRELPAAPPPDARIYVDVGKREGSLMYPLALRMVEELRHRGYGDHQLLWRPDERGRHHEKHWRRRLPKALKFLFRKR